MDRIQQPTSHQSVTVNRIFGMKLSQEGDWKTVEYNRLLRKKDSEHILRRKKSIRLKQKKSPKKGRKNSKWKREELFYELLKEIKFLKQENAEVKMKINELYKTYSKNKVLVYSRRQKLRTL